MRTHKWPRATRGAQATLMMAEIVATCAVTMAQSIAGAHASQVAAPNHTAAPVSN